MAESLFMGVPGGNPSGMSAGVSPSGTAPYIGGNTATLGGSQNPLLAPYPAGSSAVSSTFPAYSAAGTGTSTIEQLLSGMDPTGGTPLAPGQGLPSSGFGSQQWFNNLTQAFHKMGISSGLAGLLAAFISQGAGFNPTAINSMIAALGPQIASGQANIEEQYGSMGLGMSSPAALGLAGFESQVTLDEGQIISQMYEQSVQNYMNILMGLAGKQEVNTLAGVGSLVGGAGSTASSLMEGTAALAAA